MYLNLTVEDACPYGFAVNYNHTHRVWLAITVCFLGSS